MWSADRASSGACINSHVFKLVCGLQTEMDDDSAKAALLQPLKDRAERILKDLEDRKTNGFATIDLLAALAA